MSGIVRHLSSSTGHNVFKIPACGSGFQNSPSFSGGMTLQCVCGSCSVHPSTRGWRFRLSLSSPANKRGNKHRAQVSVRVPYKSLVHEGVELLGHAVMLRVAFWGTPSCFPCGHFPHQQRAMALMSLHPHQHSFFTFLNYSCCCGCAMVPPCGFDLNSPCD